MEIEYLIAILIGLIVGLGINGYFWVRSSAICAWFLLIGWEPVSKWQERSMERAKKWLKLTDEQV